LHKILFIGLKINCCWLPADLQFYAGDEFGSVGFRGRIIHKWEKHANFPTFKYPECIVELRNYGEDITRDFPGSAEIYLQGILLIIFS
jgi:hypothetical protein